MSASYGTVPPRYRLPAATHVGPVSLQVSDLQQSIAYYRAVIGLQVLASGGARATLGAGTQPLVELVERAGAHAVPQHGRLGLYHFAILVPDRAALAHFVTHLIDAGTRVASADHSVSEALYLWDPNGLGIEVYADRERAAWQSRGGELYMTTEPLNLRSLLREAPDSPWQGLPSGTTM